MAAARKWRAGAKGKNNGAVLFVFTDDRKMRIEVGYGLEGALPDAIAHRIQEEEILPRFRAGDYPGGIEAGVNAMIAATKGEYRGTGSTVAERTRRRRTAIRGRAAFPLFLLFFLFIPLLRLSRWRTYGSRGWRSGGGGGEALRFWAAAAAAAASPVAAEDFPAAAAPSAAADPRGAGEHAPLLFEARLGPDRGGDRGGGGKELGRDPSARNPTQARTTSKDAPAAGSSCSA